MDGVNSPSSPLGPPLHRLPGPGPLVEAQPVASPQHRAHLHRRGQHPFPPGQQPAQSTAPRPHIRPVYVTKSVSTICPPRSAQEDVDQRFRPFPPVRRTGLHDLQASNQPPAPIPSAPTAIKTILLGLTQRPRIALRAYRRNLRKSWLLA